LVILLETKLIKRQQIAAIEIRCAGNYCDYWIVLYPPAILS